ncbi:hypothetical protein Pmani_027834 [Petrolisthes manimaculis]|uniref:Uncharacterized protein n=1 Tax=Petrolisthes manimaculis TaxID=1843537 RepID=A0AAE1TYM7_9EUCA|nr:hypothetical protein Pmani_027834 [Petrolisthes manimaculis]
MEVGTYESMLSPGFVEKATHALTTLSYNLVLPEDALPQTSPDLMVLDKKLRGTNYKNVIIDKFLNDLVIWALEKTQEGVTATILTAISGYMITSCEMGGIESFNQILTIVLRHRHEENKFIYFLIEYITFQANNSCDDIVITFFIFLSIFSPTHIEGCLRKS